jgi:hypothetical protein
MTTERSVKLDGVVFCTLSLPLPRAYLTASGVWLIILVLQLRLSGDFLVERLRPGCK